MLCAARAATSRVMSVRTFSGSQRVLSVRTFSGSQRVLSVRTFSGSPTASRRLHGDQPEPTKRKQSSGVAFYTVTRSSRPIRERNVLRRRLRPLGLPLRRSSATRFRPFRLAFDVAHGPFDVAHGPFDVRTFRRAVCG